MPTLMVDAPRRSYDCLGIDLYRDNQDDASSPLSHGHSFFFSAPTSPRLSQTLVQNNNLDFSSVPDSTFIVDDDGGNKQDNDGNENDDFEFEFISPSAWDEVPCSPTLIFSSSSRMLLPPAPLLKPPPHIRKPHPVSAQEPSQTCARSNVGKEANQQEKSSKVRKWRLKDFLSQSNGQKWPPIPKPRPGGQQGSISSSPSSVSGKKTMNGTAMQMKAASPPSFPLPPPPPTPISSLPSSAGKSRTTPTPNEILHKSKRVQLRNQQRKTASLPYRPGFLRCLGFPFKFGIHIT